MKRRGAKCRSEDSGGALETMSLLNQEPKKEEGGGESHDGSNGKSKAAERTVDLRSGPEQSESFRRKRFRRGRFQRTGRTSKKITKGKIPKGDSKAKDSKGDAKGKDSIWKDGKGKKEPYKEDEAGGSAGRHCTSQSVRGKRWEPTNRGDGRQYGDFRSSLEQWIRLDGEWSETR